MTNKERIDEYTEKMPTRCLDCSFLESKIVNWRDSVIEYTCVMSNKVDVCSGWEKPNIKGLCIFKREYKWANNQRLQNKEKKHVAYLQRFYKIFKR